MATIDLAGQSFDTQDIIRRYHLVQDDPTIGEDIIRDLKSMLMSDSRVTTFGHLIQVTKVATSAKTPKLILKISSVNAMFSKSKSTYHNSVINSANKNGQNVDTFKVRKPNYVSDDDCASIARSIKNGLPMIVYQGWLDSPVKSKSYYIDGETGDIMSIKMVASYLTASAANALLSPPTKVENKGNGIEHNVYVRSVYAQNIISASINKSKI